MYFIINCLIGYVEEIERCNDKYLVVTKSMCNRKIIHSFDNIWSHIENKINPNNFNNNNKIKDYDKLRFNIDLPTEILIEFRSLIINVSCFIEKDGKYYPEIYLDECLYVKNNVY